MKYFKKIIKNNLIISLIAFSLVLLLAGFLLFKHFNALFAAKFDLNIIDLDTEHLKSTGAVLDISIFDDPKFKALKINEVSYPTESASVKSNPFEFYERKNGEEGENKEND